MASAAGCLMCSSQISPESTATANFSPNLKQLIGEISVVLNTALDFSANGNYSLCLRCENKLKIFDNLLCEFIKLRAKICNLSTAISKLIIAQAQGQIAMDFSDEFKDWNDQRLRTFLVGHLDSENFLSNGLRLLDKLDDKNHTGSESDQVVSNSVMSLGDDDFETLEYVPSEKKKKNVETPVPSTNSKDQYVCTHCGCSFRKAHWLRTHMTAHDRTSTDTSSIGADNSPTQLAPPNLKGKKRKLHPHQKDDQLKKDFPCPICKIRYVQKVGMNIHLHAHHADECRGTVCPICKKSFNTSSLMILHLNFHTSEFECAQVSCKKSFKLSHLLAEHEKVHEPNPTFFDCDFCELLFDSSDRRDAHVNIHSSIQKIHTCETCGESFPLKSALSDHITRIHKTASYTCQVCQKKFRKFSVFKDHELTHTGEVEKLYRCTHCGQVCRNAYLLKLHVRKHTGQMPFKCDYCNHPGFNYIKAQRLHLANVHSGIYLKSKKFLCRVCWENFELETQLDEHSHTHNQYKCQICDREFKSYRLLNDHLMRHANVKPFKCPFCKETSYWHKHTLLDHIITKHPNEDTSNLSILKETVTVKFEPPETESVE